MQWNTRKLLVDALTLVVMLGLLVAGMLIDCVFLIATAGVVGCFAWVASAFEPASEPDPTTEENRELSGGRDSF